MIVIINTINNNIILGGLTWKKKEEKKVNTEELKSEASTTVNQVKDTIKNVDIKKDSIETKGFIAELFKDPLGKIKEIVDKRK